MGQDFNSRNIFQVQLNIHFKLLEVDEYFMSNFEHNF